MSSISKHNKGFTLIELMVAIAIIAVLATIGLVIYSQTQKQARNQKRIEDLKAVQTALESYKGATGSYPSTSSWVSHCSNGDNYIPNLAPSYMPAIPKDPSTNGSSPCYEYTSDGIGYKFYDSYVPSSELSTSDIQRFQNYIDPMNPSSPNACASPSGSGDRSFAIYSGDTFRCQ